MYKPWTKDEVTYLTESWGMKSLKTISERLNRSKNAILMKKQKLGLGAFLDNGDYITVNQLVKTIGYNNSSKVIKTWMKKQLPTINKKVNNNSFKIIKIDDFWKWAEANKTYLDFSKFERHSLGKEPKWVEEKRQRDIMNSQYKRRNWTKDDDEKLLFLVNQHKYDYTEISERMQRSEIAIQHRLTKLNVKARPITKDQNVLRWTDEEVKKLIKLIKEGYDYKTIQNKFITNKTVTSIKSKIFRIYETSDLDKVRTIIDKKGCTISSRKKWTSEERQLLEDMVWEGWSYKDIQKALPGRSLDAIKKQVEINKYER